ncbi:thioesterase-like superfamily-domain-containing protein [Aspergillus californicus]
MPSSSSSQPIPSLLQSLSSFSLKDGSKSQFIANITQDWCTQHSVLGGYLVALMLSAAQRYLNLENKEKYPDPIHIFTQFLYMVPPGPVEISCKTLRRTSRACVVQVDLTQVSGTHPPASSTASQYSFSTACFAVATLSDLASEIGFTISAPGPASTPELPLKSLPPRTECILITHPVVNSTPVTRKLNWVAPRSPDGLWGHRLGGHVRETWLSFRDGSKINDLQILAMLVDLPLQPPATHKDPNLFYSQYALSTLCLSVELKKRPSLDTEWVFVRSDSQSVSRGRYDLDVRIYDESDSLLALSRHVVLISELKGRQKGKGKI